MEYNYGNLIKIERMRKEMKQAVLARGICSVSYLSKIENNQTSPSEEVLELLFERLGLDVPLYYDFAEQAKKIEIEIRDILRDALLSRKDSGKQKQIQKYLYHPVVNQSKDLYITLLMTLARFQIMPDGEGDYIKQIGWVEDQLSKENKLRFMVMKSLILFDENAKEESFKLLEYLNKEISHANIPDWELADMRYIIGASYYRFTEYLPAIENVKSALEYFQEHFYLERIVECHLIIGLSLKRCDCVPAPSVVRSQRPHLPCRRP